MSIRLKRFRPVIIIVGLIVSMGTVAFVITGHGQVNQLQERVITRVKQNNEPVQIMKVEVSGRVVAVGQKFPGGDDWFKGLTVTIKNVSDRPVRFVSVGIYIPRTFTPRPDNFAVSFLNFGKDDPPATDVAASGTEPLLLPGKSVDLKVTDEHLNTIKTLLELGNFPPQIFRIDLIVREVLFPDDTKWSGEQIFRRDPNDPHNWIRADGISSRIHDHTIRRATWNPDTFFYLKS